ncbi:hypothetical protein E4T56_gene80, partial [Termitomyces sp. T112]
IGGVIVEHDGGRGTADLDDRSALASHTAGHLADHRLKELIGADILQIGHRIQFLARGVEERLEQAPAGGVDGNVHAPHRRHGRISHRGQTLCAGDVASRPMAGVGLGKFGQHAFLAARHGDLGAFVQKSAGDMLAHIALAAGAQNDGALACQSAHFIPSLCLGCPLLSHRPVRHSSPKGEWQAAGGMRKVIPSTALLRRDKEDGEDGSGTEEQKGHSDRGQPGYWPRQRRIVAETVAALEKHGGRVFGSAFDMEAGHDAYRAWLAGAAEALGGCDIFVPMISTSGAGATGDWQKGL